MAPSPTTRHRPDLQLNTRSFSSPVSLSRYSSGTLTPSATLSHSPYRSAGFKPSSSYPGSIRSPRHSERSLVYLCLLWFRKLLSIRLVWLLMTLFALFYWWRPTGWHGLDAASARSRSLARGVLDPSGMKKLQFFPASNPKIRYVGRWTATPNRLRTDGTFPGVYFEVTVNSTKSLYLSLRNTPVLPGSTGSPGPSKPDPDHFSFLNPSLSNGPAPPISLLAQIDQEEYVLLPNSSSLVTIRAGDLERDVPHDVRIIAPMTDDGGSGVVQVEGIWLEKGGQLLRVEGSQLDEEVEGEDTFSAENEQIGKKHSLGWSRFVSSRKSEIASASEQTSSVKKDLEEVGRISGQRKRVLEVITDSPGSLGRQAPGLAKRTGGENGLIGGVMGWEYALGEMFGVDHVTLGLDGMCLVQDCIGGVGTPAGVGDVFFRSGPPSTTYFKQPWQFHNYIPDVMILNLGASDYMSYEHHASEYNQSAWDFYTRFEDSYVSLVKGIRQLAYPKHPDHLSASRSSSSSGYGSRQKKIPAAIPIFIMRPLRGEYEHGSQGAVNRLRADGDSSVFWLDTSGWLDPDDTESKDRDFALDETVTPPRWRLTHRGNQRVAIYLHLHVCQYLAAEDERCSFLQPESYEGKIYDPQSVWFDVNWENAKEKKLKKLLWEH
ncbi:MAG: hypothetical protein M1823_000276 [Watsoniomyces obsoletus]|nr:MAG: hypothetical protein M1823_000276 [Watsoniomyces obsoletus]